MIKACSKCNVEKPLNDFYIRPTRRGGFDSQCKVCIIAQTRKWKKDNPEKHRAIGRAVDQRRRVQKSEYRKSRRAIHDLQVEKYRQKNPDKHKARKEMYNAIRRGDLVRLPCEVCGEPKTQGHHDDYSKPLQVRWLCETHHKMHHRKDNKPLNQESIICPMTNTPIAAEFPNTN